MTNNDFYIDYNVTGAERKRLVEAISTYMETDSKYLGAPTFAYQVGYFTIDRNGVVSFDSRADSGEIEGLVGALAEQGFVTQISGLNCKDEEVPAGGLSSEPAPNSAALEGDVLTIQMPAAGFTPEALTNLTNLLAAKGHLICKALGVKDLPVETGPDMVSFPWFSGEVTSEELKAYTHLVTALCSMARSQKRVAAKEKVTDNDKYTFRCFLLRLGFIGAEYKAERKILLRNLTGNGAFKTADKPA